MPGVVVEDVDEQCRGGVFASHGVGDVDAVAGGVVEQFVSGAVVTDHAHQCHGGAELCESDGLVGAFAAQHFAAGPNGC